MQPFSRILLTTPVLAEGLDDRGLDPRCGRRGATEIRTLHILRGSHGISYRSALGAALPWRINEGMPLFDLTWLEIHLFRTDWGRYSKCAPRPSRGQPQARPSFRRRREPLGGWSKDTPRPPLFDESSCRNPLRHPPLRSVSPPMSHLTSVGPGGPTEPGFGRTSAPAAPFHDGV